MSSGHFASHDALGQPFHDGRFAHARLANEHGVVLAAALQHLNGAADFVVAANHRVQLALACALGQIERVFLQRLALAFAVGAVHRLAAAHGVNGRFQRLARQPRFLGDAGGFAFGFGERQQKHFAGDELVAALDGFFFGGLQQLHQIRAGLHLLLALHLRQALHGSIQRLRQLLRVHARALQKRLGAAFLPQHGGQQVLGLDVGVVFAQRQRLGVAQRVLKFGGEFVGSHQCFLLS